MSILPHTVAGAVAGSYFNNPILAGAAGILSHFLLDLIPHFDPPLSKTKPMKKLVKKLVTLVICVDVLISLLILWLFQGHNNVIIGGVMGPLVDVDNLLQYGFPNSPFPLISKLGITIHNPGSKLHRKLHFKSFLVNLTLGIILQLIVSILGLWFLSWKLNLHLEKYLLIFF